jgi:membrane protease YdiL (CAAX protease family)
LPAVPAVGLSALLFASAHLLDPGAVLVLPGLLLVGIVSGILAVRSGDLSRPILLHVGFNVLVVVVALGGA